ncbi:T9SS type A sorting domain-containing protein [Arthrospira platensis SPKY1]|nr:T9SS type A sorting domain-containing protein [Arthrospira platensis SPKY1]
MPVHYRRPLEVFPNPSRGHFQVVLPEGFGRGRLSVLAPSGQRLLSRAVGPGGGTEAIDLSGLPSGAYFIELHPEDGRERVFYGQQAVKVD